MRVGDVVVAVRPFVLHCGTGIYTHAIVAGTNPLIVVSEDGTMLWSATIDETKLRPLCQAHPDIVRVALDRYERECERHMAIRQKVDAAPDGTRGTGEPKGVE